MTSSASGHKACIVVPTDFQLPARRALMHAVRLAVALDARLKIVHVIKAPADSPGAAPDSRYLRSRRTSALLALGRVTRTVKDAGVHAEPLLLYGIPSVCIEEVANRTPAHLIVMGTEGRAGWDRLHLGSTAESLVRNAPCPVLTVHGGLAGDVLRHPATVRLQRLLVATDFSRHADAAFRIVCGLAVKLHASVGVIHASNASLGKSHARRMLAKHVLFLQRHGIGAEGMCVPGNPVEEILVQAKKWQADLLAIGTRGRRGLSRILLGSVAEALLKRAGCPVLTVKKVRQQSPLSVQTRQRS